MLGEHLNKFIIVYLNNIIIYSNSEEEYFQYIKQVLQRLVNKKILVAIKKYKFIIKLGKLSIDLKKVKAIVNQQKLNNIIKLKSFLGFCNYY